jgi:lipopolysaccharide export system protein LptC
LTVIHQAEPYRESAALAAMRPRTTASLFRAATRHSRRVRFARRAIPVATIAVVAVFALMAWFNPLRWIGDLPLELRDVVISGTKIRMEAPRLSGYTRDARPYDLSALSAAQDVARPEVIELTQLRAKIQMHDHTEVEMSAATGLFDTKAQILTLDKNIVVKSSSGYEGHLNHAVIDTRTGSIVSEKPVRLKMLNGTVNANAMEIENAGEVIRLDRGVSMQLMPNKDQGMTAQVPPQ